MIEEFEATGDKLATPISLAAELARERRTAGSARKPPTNGSYSDQECGKSSVTVVMANAECSILLLVNSFSDSIPAVFLSQHRETLAVLNIVFLQHEVKA